MMFFPFIFFMPSDLLALHLLENPYIDKNPVDRQYIVKLITATQARLPGFRSWLYPFIIIYMLMNRLLCPYPFPPKKGGAILVAGSSGLTYIKHLKPAM